MIPGGHFLMSGGDLGDSVFIIIITIIITTITIIRPILPMEGAVDLQGIEGDF